MAALSDVNLNVTVNECLCVLCDIFDISYVNNSMKPTLRMIYLTESSMSYTFPDYIPIIQIVQRNFSHLQIYIRDKIMNVPAILSEDSELTLPLRKQNHNE